MALVVNTNVASITSQMYVNQTNKDMADTMARLSSGKRINTAADDAAGVAIASRLKSEIRGTNQAIRNALDAQAMIDTAEGAHSEIEVILQRMRELAVQSANDTNGAADRTALQNEMTQLTNEIDRIAATTTWAGIYLLNGDGSDGQVSDTTADSTNTFSFQIASNETGTDDTISVAVQAVDSGSLGISGTSTTPTISAGTVRTAAGFNVTVSGGDVTFSAATAAPTAAGTDDVTITVDGFAVSFDVFSDALSKGYANNADGLANAFASKLEALGLAGISGTTDSATLGSDTKVTLSRSGSVDVSTNSAANTALNTIDAAISELNTQRASLGAVSNRLDNNIANLSNIAINLEDGRSRIEDADFAQESANLAKQQIMLQAGTAMLAQANASQQNVLSLIS
jgi:flagellin